MHPGCLGVPLRSWNQKHVLPEVYSRGDRVRSYASHSLLSEGHCQRPTQLCHSLLGTDTAKKILVGGNKHKQASTGVAEDKAAPQVI